MTNKEIFQSFLGVDLKKQIPKNIFNATELKLINLGYQIDYSKYKVVAKLKSDPKFHIEVELEGNWVSVGNVLREKILIHCIKDFNRR